MSKSGKKPRQKFQARDLDAGKKKEKKEKDWSFEDIARSKTRRTW